MGNSCRWWWRFRDVTGPASSVDSEVVLFNGTTGKTIKAATITGIPKLTSGVISAATAGTDYVKPDTATNFTATQRPDYGTTSISTTSTHTFDGADQIREFTLTNTITVTFGAPTGITQYAMYKFILKAGDANTRRTLECRLQVPVCCRSADLWHRD